MVLAPVHWDILTEIEQANAQIEIPEECPSDKTFVLDTLRTRLLEQIHCLPSSGHPGITATMHLIQYRFWWPTISADTTQFIRRCQISNMHKTPRQAPAGLLQPLPIPQRPWSHIAIDFITDLLTSNNCTTIFTIMDRFSKACHLLPLPKLPTAFQTAEHLCNLVFRL